jgi:hypothetical protein
VVPDTIRGRATSNAISTTQRVVRARRPKEVKREGRKLKEGRKEGTLKAGRKGGTLKAGRKEGRKLANPRESQDPLESRLFDGERRPFE